MTTSDLTGTLAITPQSPLLLEDAVGARLTALCGEVWITQRHDSRDIVLREGQSFTVEAPGCLVASPNGESSVALRPGPAVHSLRAAGRFWHDLLAHRLTGVHAAAH